MFGAGSPTDGVSVGQAAAIAYASAGATVAIVDARRENAERTATKLVQMGFGATVIEADVTKPASVQAAIEAVVAGHGRIDILHNNVGVPMAAAFEEYSADDWSRGMSLNCIGAANTIRSALPHLLAARGVIVNVSSLAAIRHTGMNYAVYNASKAALDALTIAVALEYADRGVRANGILPGLLDTEMGRGLVAAGAKSRDQRSPTGAQGDVWDVANAAVFLASQEARYVNGHMLVVDGGLSQRC